MPDLDDECTHLSGVVLRMICGRGLSLGLSSCSVYPVIGSCCHFFLLIQV